jgi:hypothetical protein
MSPEIFEKEVIVRLDGLAAGQARIEDCLFGVERAANGTDSRGGLLGEVQQLKKNSHSHTRLYALLWALALAVVVFIVKEHLRL